MAGHRGFYDGDWEVVTRHEPLTEFGDHEWELYNLAEDRTELRDLAAEHPERVAELAAGWEAAARANQVYPLEEGSRYRYVVRPPYDEPLKEPVRDRAPAPTRSSATARSCSSSGARSTSTWSSPSRPATRACWSPTATRAAGTSLYVDDGDELVFVHNGYGAMTEVRVRAGARRRASGSGSPSPRRAAGRGTSTVSVDGAVRAATTRAS